MKYPKAIIFVVLLLILSSCKKKCEEYYLGSLIYMNPYNGNEVLNYHNSTGDDIIFIGQGRSTRMNTLQASYSGDVCTSTEWDNCYFEEESKLFEIMIFLRPTTSNVHAHLDLILQNHSYIDSGYYDYQYQINFKMPLDKNNLGDDQSYYDSLFIYNTMQYDVFAATPRLFKSISLKEVLMEPIHPSQIYYNVHNGLVKVDFDDGSTWELKEIVP